MKNHKKGLKQLIFYSSILFLFTIVNSCVKIEDQKAYYNFQEEDYDKILNFEENQIVKFQNNSGELMGFNARNIYGIKKINTLGWIESSDNLKPPIPFPDSNSIDFDTQFSSFHGIENKSQVALVINYRFRRFPKNIYQAQKNGFDEYHSEFLGQIYFNKWNALNSTRIINIDFGASTDIMDVNGIRYDRVYSIESGNPNVETCGFYYYSVNRIYYDLHTGIIGYDEVDGTQWRLIN